MSISFNNWDDDKLGRKAEAEYLTEYLISAYRNSNASFVLNLNSGWGCGKSFLLKRWMQSLRKMEHHVVYFDAWKNDYSTDPLLSFISDLKEQLYESDVASTNKKSFKTNVSKVVNAGAKISKAGMPIAIAMAVKALTGTSLNSLEQLIDGLKDDEKSDHISDELKNDVANSGAKIASLLASEAVENIQRSKIAVIQFQKHLENVVGELVKSGNESRPLFIFVDELDRCRPTFSIELLEHIKHLFKVKGIVFVIATDTDQLKHSVGVVYGSGFNAEGYLQRFFDVEYKLEVSASLGFSDLLLSEISNELDRKLFCPLFDNQNQDFTSFHSKLSLAFRLSPRDQEKVWNVVKAVVFVFDETTERFKLQFPFLLLLSILYCKHRLLFQELEARPASHVFNEWVKAKFGENVLFDSKDFNSYPRSQQEFRGGSYDSYGVLDVSMLYFDLIPLTARKFDSEKFGRTKPIINKIFDYIEYTLGHTQYEDSSKDDFLGLRSYFTRIKKAGNFLR